MFFKLIIIIFLLLGILNPIANNQVDEAVAFFIFVIYILTIFVLKSFAKVALWILILTFFTNSWFISKELRFFLTHDIPYNNDPGVFLTTYKSIESGQDYYDSFKSAMLGRFAQQIIPKDIWGWRMPTIFTFGKFYLEMLSQYISYTLF